MKELSFNFLEEVEIDLNDYKHDYNTGHPALYVGTYRKYNNGDLSGMWIDLVSCGDYDTFFEVCRELHKDEEDPEYMYQDCDNLPEQWYSESGINEETFDRIIEWAELDEDEREAYEAYMDVRCDNSVSIEDFREHFCGEWNSEYDFTECLIDDLGILDDVPEGLRSYFDIQKYSDELFMCDYDFCDGFVFRVS